MPFENGWESWRVNDSGSGIFVLTALLHREEWVVNDKKVYRICREEQLPVPRRRRKRIRQVARAEQPVLERANQSWAMDFPFGTEKGARSAPQNSADLIWRAYLRDVLARIADHPVSRQLSRVRS